MLQPLVDAANHDLFDDNPIPINVILAALAFVIGTALIVYVYIQGNRMRKEQAEQEAEWERCNVIREEDESEFSEY
jgi:hypothetical protein